MLVSIITVCYNSEKTIAQTIESVRAQSYPNIEYLIIDGGSTDRTLEIVRGYESSFGGRMKLISEPDNGIYDAMNKGIIRASGELIGIINSDDFYEPGAVESMVCHLPDVPYAVMYGETRNLIGDVEQSVTMMSHHYLSRHSLNHPSVFITKKTYEKYGMYDLQYQCVADYDLFLRYAKYKEILFVPVYEIIANFRSEGISSTQKAYFDLLKMQKNYGMITGRQAWILKQKARCTSFGKHKKGIS